MRFFTRTFDLVSVTFVIFPIFSPSAAVPHAGRHHRRAHRHGVTSASAHSGSGLRFNRLDGNRTNHDFYLLPVQVRQLAYTTDTASIVTAHESAATAAVNLPTGLSGHINSSSVDHGFASQTVSSADSSAYIVQPHERVHQTAQAVEMYNIGYTATVSSLSQTESSPTKAALATLVYRDYEDVAQSSTTPAALQPALFYTIHLPKIYRKTTKAPSRRLPGIKRKTRTITQTATIPRPAPSVSQTQASTTPESAQIQTSVSDPLPGNYEGYRTPRPQSSESQPGYQSSVVMTPSVISPIEMGPSTVTSSTRIPEVSSGVSTTSSSSAVETSTPLQSSTEDGYGDALTSTTPQSSMMSASSDTPTLTSPQSSTVLPTSAGPESSTTPGYIDAPTSTSFSSDTSLYQPTSASSFLTSSTDAVSPTVVPPPPMSYASGSSVIPPRILTQKLHGVSSNEPSSQYIKMKNPPNLKLPDDLLVVGINNALSTSYGIAPDTGSIPINDTTKSLITDLKSRPHLSRDGGKGGYLNGQKLFLFCDTGSYMPPTNEKMGDFLGFVSSSAAIDVGMKGAYGQPLVLEDGIGEWGDDVGRMRGFSPLTEGEQSYNLAMQGKGQRYAIWPESSLIPLNHTHALIYAPIVYTEVDWVTRHAEFTYTGATLLSISAGPDSGPHAVRVVDKMFYQEEVEWGTIAGFRSYGPSGFGGNDGRIYVIGKVEWGLLLGRVDAASVTDRESYEYWNGDSWTQDMPGRSSKAYFLPGPYMDGDLIYSPAHLTFIWVYLSPFADNTFYFRYLQADTAIRPAGAPGADSTGDFAENLVKYKWSEEEVLYKASSGPTGKYIYAGGVHQGYFDNEDISNGGKKMLLSWTVPTGENPATMASEYLHITAHVEFV